MKVLITHDKRHVIGGMLMIVGVGMAKGSTELHVPFVVHFACDVVGYAVHGVGAIPFIYHFAKRLEPEGHVTVPPPPIKRKRSAKVIPFEQTAA